MQKTLCFALALCLTLNGCGLFRRSETWTLVRGVRVDTRGESDPSQAYANALSARLADAHVEHKVVTYQFRYRTHLREEAITTRTAVVYRDATHPSNPWWLMDEHLNQPVWLPSDELSRQISFYLRDYAEVVETRDVPGRTPGGGHKAMLAARFHRPPHFGMAEDFRGHSSALIPFRTSATRAAQLRSSTPTGRDRIISGKQRWLLARRSDAGDGLALLRPDSKREKQLRGSSAFFAMHGTAFDPLSAIDRRKMAELRQPQVVRGVKTARAY